MMNQLTEIAPAGALVAAVVWGGVSYFATGPELASRIARVDYVHTCEEALHSSMSVEFDEAIAEISRPSELERQGSMTNSYMSGMNQQYSDQMQFLDLVTGGGFSGAMGAVNNAANEARAARERAEAAIERRREAALKSAPDQCSCQVTAAMQESQNAWALYAGSFGLIEQDGVTEFASLMRANARACADRVQL